MKIKKKQMRLLCIIMTFVFCITYMMDLPTVLAGQLLQQDMDDILSESHEMTTRVDTTAGKTLVKLTYDEDALIPEDAELVVREITADTDADTYDTYMEQAAEVLSDDSEAAFSVAHLFDISILSGDEEIEPAAPVQVEITLNDSEKGGDDNDIQVVHFAEEDIEVLDTMTVDEKNKVAVSFETDGFSLYAVVKLDEFDASQNGTSLASKLNGQSFVIVSPTNSDAYGALQVTSMKTSVNNLNLDSLAAVPVSIDTALSTYEDLDGATATTWIFEANGTGFNIFTYIKLNDEIDTEVKRYLHFSVNDTDSTLSGLTLDEKPQQITVTEGIGELAGRYRISCDGNSVNLDSQDVEKGFYGWNGVNSQISDPDKRKTLFMWFCTPKNNSDSVQDDLDGKSFAIVYKGARDGDADSGRDDNVIGDKNVALMAETGQNLDGKDRLEAKIVPVDGNKITRPENGKTAPAKWTFHRAEKTTYTISTTVNGDTKYLAVNESGQISLRDTGTGFTVTTKGKNRCRIGWTNTKGITYYLNLDSSNLRDGFNFWDAAWYDVPWYKNEKSFGGDDAPAWLEADSRFKTRAEGYRAGEEVYSTNWTWGTIVDEHWTEDELTQEQKNKGWAGDWKVQHADPENEKLYLYLCEPYDDSWPLHGQEYAVISKNRQKALLTEPLNGDGIQLAGSGNLLVLPDGETFLDSNGDIPLWKFEKADEAGWYYISTTVSGEKKYLSFENKINTLSLKNKGVPIQVYYYSNNNGEGYVFTIGAGTDDEGNSGKIFLNCQSGGFHNYIRTNGEPTNNGDFFYLVTPTSQKSYAIVNLIYQGNTNEVPGHVAGTGPREAGALRDTFRDDGKAILAGQVFVWDEVSDDTRADNGTSYMYGGPNKGASPSQWMFFPAGGRNKYYIARIKNGTSLEYLKSETSGGTVTFSFADVKDGNCIFTMAAAEKIAGSHSNSVVTIETHDGYRLYGVNDSSSSGSADYVIRAHKSSESPVPYSEQFVLCETGAEVPEKVLAEKKASGEIQDGDKVVIYYRELTDEKTKTYSYFAIGRDGKRHQVTDVSDSIKYWATDSQNIEWYVRDDGNDYLTLLNYNTMEERYYSILPGGSEQDSIVDDIIRKGTVKGSDWKDGMTEGTQWEMSAARLPGRELGHYGSKIENWIFPKECFYGIQYDKTAKRFRPVEAGDSNEIEFYYAVVDDADNNDSQNKPTVDTVDSKSLGITIKMFDYETNTSSPTDRSKDIENVLVTGGWRGGTVEGYATSGVLEPVMKDGYPVAANNGQSLSALFGKNSGHFVGEANHLFLDSVYQTTGYLQYRSENNFAEYDMGSGDFTVYKSVGTTDYHQQAVYSHGDFFPYNKLGTTLSDNNFYMFDYNGLQLDTSDPRFGDKIYLIDNPNYHFGMTLEANFSQPKDGVAKYGDPLYFAFNGDDDMWVYVDNVLLLDIGGIHDARSGFINFKTGEIWQQDDGKATKNELRTSIAQRFKDAGQFPDGTAWNDSAVSRYFINLTKDANDNYITGTFTDYSEHSLNMYYLERGAGASNLDLTFNLMPLKDDSFYVSKELDAENGIMDLDEYRDMEYTYRAYRFEATRSSNDGTWSTWIPGEDILLANTNYTLFDENGQEIKPTGGGKYTTDADGIFTLKPGQTAEFELKDVHDGTNGSTDTRTGYRVEELFTEETGENTQYQVYVNDESQPVDGKWENPNGSDKGWWMVSGGNHLLNDQYQVYFVNKLLKLATLQLKKEVNNTTYEDAVPDSSKEYTFVLFLENAEHKLVQYNGAYTIVGDMGEYQADIYGRIKVKKGQTIQIENILPGRKFFVYEEGGAGFNLDSYELDGKTTAPADVPVWVFTDNASGNKVLQEKTMFGISGAVTGINTVTSVVVNNEIKTVNIILQKTDNEGNSLDGASFELRYGDLETILNDAVKANSSGAGAVFMISDLPVNQTYKLAETKAPEGYMILKEPVVFRLYDAVDAGSGEVLSGILFPGDGQDRADYLLSYGGTVYTKDKSGAFTVKINDKTVFNNGIFFAPNGVQWKVDMNGEDNVMIEVTVPNSPGELPTPSPTPQDTPTPSGTPQDTPTPSPTPQDTPTPSGTPQDTPNPSATPQGTPNPSTTPQGTPNSSPSPQTPGNPKTPDDPKEPGKPQTPDDPKEPGKPQTPDKPSKPGLPQTGQLWWPVMVMSVVGLLSCMIGFLLIRSQYIRKHTWRKI